MLLGTRMRIRATAATLVAILAGFAIEFPARLGGAMLGVVAAMLLGGICVALIGGCFLTNVRKRALFERLRLRTEIGAIKSAHAIRHGRGAHLRAWIAIADTLPADADGPDTAAPVAGAAIPGIGGEVEPDGAAVGPAGREAGEVGGLREIG